MTFFNLFFIALGLAIIVLTGLRHPVFWEARKVRRLRGRLGDSGTMILYILVGVVLVIGGLYI